MIWPFNVSREVQRLRAREAGLVGYVNQMNANYDVARRRAEEAEQRAEAAEKALAAIKARPTIHCSFCGKSEQRVTKIIAGPTVFICNECVDLCAEIISDGSVTAKATTGGTE